MDQALKGYSKKEHYLAIRDPSYIWEVEAGLYIHIHIYNIYRCWQLMF